MALKDTSEHTDGIKSSDCHQNKKPGWKALSLILFLSSLFSLYLALYFAGRLSNVNHLFVQNTWVFFLLTPLPIASIIFGCILKSKGCKYKKNVITGIIMTALLCLYGCFSFLFPDTYDHSDAPILKVEQYTGIHIPTPEQINTLDWTQDSQSFPRGYVYYTSDIYFDSETAELFESQIAKDSRWISSMPNNLVGIASPFSDLQNYDYLLIYNIDDNEFNEMPQESGTYDFINIFYQAQGNEMSIVEYQMDYIK